MSKTHHVSDPALENIRYSFLFLAFASFMTVLQSSGITEVVSNVIYAESHLAMEPVDMYVGLSKNLEISNHYINSDNKGMVITANFKNIRMRLPDGQQVFFEKFNYGDRIEYGKCNDDMSECRIYPQYLYTDQDICIDAVLSDDWGATGFSIKFNGDPKCVEIIQPIKPPSSCGPG